jgi:hypothetical protein
MDRHTAAALKAAQRELPLFPCHSRTDDGRCTCGKDCASPAKHPLTRRGLLDASKHVTVVAGWWDRWPWANLGMPTGKPSGIVVLDCDPRHDGFATLAKLIGAGAGLATLEVQTGGGGVHLWFRLPDGVDVTNSSKGLVEHFGPGLDVRGTGGYVLIPPSLHISGQRYRYAAGELQPLPAWLVEVLNPPPPPAAAKMTQIAPASSYTGLDRYWRSVLEQRLAVLRTTTVNRNDALNEAAFRLGQIVALGAPEAEIRGYLAQAGLAMGLDTGEVGGPDGQRGTVNSGVEAGKLQPDPWFRGVRV